MQTVARPNSIEAITFKEQLNSLGIFVGKGNKFTDSELNKPVYVVHTAGEVYFVVIFGSENRVIVPSPFKFEDEGLVYALNYNIMSQALVLFEEELYFEDAGETFVYFDVHRKTKYPLIKYDVPDSEVLVAYVNDMLEGGKDELMSEETGETWDSESFITMTRFVLSVMDTNIDVGEKLFTGDGVVYLRESGLYALTDDSYLGYVKGIIPVNKEYGIDDLELLAKLVARTKKTVNLSKVSSKNSVLTGDYYVYFEANSVPRDFETLYNSLEYSRNKKGTAFTIAYQQLMQATRGAKISGEALGMELVEDEGDLVVEFTSISTEGDVSMDKKVEIELLDDKGREFVKVGVTNFLKMISNMTEMGIEDAEATQGDFQLKFIYEDNNIYYKYLNYEGVIMYE